MDIKLTIPKSWEEVTVGKFQEILNISNDLNDINKMVEIISILSDEDPDVIKNLPFDKIKTINNELKFIYTKPSNIFKNIINIKGVKYGLRKMDELTLGEIIDLESYQEDVINNLHFILSILYRPLIDQNMTEDYYKIVDYDSTKNISQSLIIKDNVSIDYVNGVTVFFSIFAYALTNSSSLYSEVLKVTQIVMN